MKRLQTSRLVLLTIVSLWFSAFALSVFHSVKHGPFDKENCSIGLYLEHHSHVMLADAPASLPAPGFIALAQSVPQEAVRQSYIRLSAFPRAPPSLS